jgi:hypothetical protein
MKRQLAQEALYSSESWQSHSELFAGDSIPAMENAGERVRQIDPNGKRGLALLEEISRPTQK